MNPPRTGGLDPDGGYEVEAYREGTWHLYCGVRHVKTGRSRTVAGRTLRVLYAIRQDRKQRR